MNEEIANFIVRFTTDNLQEIKDGLKDVTKSVDAMNDSFQKSSSKTGGFFEKLANWTISLGGLATAFYGVKRAMEAVGQTAEQVQQTYIKADLAGVAPETMERWNIATWLFSSSEGEAKSAVSQFFTNLNNLERNLREQKYGDDMLERMSRYGFTLDYLYGAGLPENRDRTMQKLHEVFQRQDLDAADLQALQTVFNIPSQMVEMFKLSDDEFKNIMDWAESQRVETKNPETLKASIEYKKASIEWAQMWKEVKLDLLPVVRDLKEALKPLKEPIKELAKSVAEMLVVLQPIATFFTTLVANGLRNVTDLIKVLKGEMSFADYWKKHYTSEGKNEPIKPIDINNQEEIKRAWLGANESVRKMLEHDFPGIGAAITGGATALPSVDMNATLEININGEKYLQDMSGNIRSQKTGEIVGNAYSYATANKG